MFKEKSMLKPRGTALSPSGIPKNLRLRCEKNGCDLGYLILRIMNNEPRELNHLKAI
ncbi:uncharacterized protein FOMMEDRAFT_161888 [Fomitiporia mediterranea MF3/22]|uniref:uncharacterized protein n=1 Tax=Fomitiporia mediterranea (strain MF3/22) TaxID=694068 RepID=UPI00044080E5|nr:uncharacterized protein FOMMEDRAFT_161888 [Fomitiporia mediterranea MF3/22]EJC98513.1 hypothetical protein FOMMEDRAFT_161888 [Fomitiporia mediterranea MF3/22]